MLVEGRKVPQYRQQYVFDGLEIFNSRHRHRLNEELELTLLPLQREAFLQFVGAGQPSVLHLPRFIDNAVVDGI